MRSYKLTCSVIPNHFISGALRLPQRQELTVKSGT